MAEAFFSSTFDRYIILSKTCHYRMVFCGHRETYSPPFLEVQKDSEQDIKFRCDEGLNRVVKTSALNGKDDAVYLGSAM